MSKIETIALFGAGDMGGGVGRTLVEGGFRVVSDLAPRSPASRARAEAAGVETVAFKRDVRKLKELGLTISLAVGYELSPRGRAVLGALE